MTLAANTEAGCAGEERHSEITRVGACVIETLSLYLNVVCALLLIEVCDSCVISIYIDVAEGGGFLIPCLLCAISLDERRNASLPQLESRGEKCLVDLCALFVWKLEGTI
jgi:hypothetical protein